MSERFVSPGERPMGERFVNRELSVIHIPASVLPRHPRDP